MSEASKQGLTAPRTRLGFGGLLLTLAIYAPHPALAHPHEWIDASFEIQFDGKGQLAAIRHHWLLDQGFSAFALQGLDTNGDGRYSAGELKPLAQENVESLKDFDYFTFIKTADYQAGFAAPSDYHVELAGDRLILSFTLPLAQPFSTKASVSVEVYDPSYYIAVSLADAKAVTMTGAPPACRLTVRPARGPSSSAAALLGPLGAGQRQLPSGLQGLTRGIENTAMIACGPAGAEALPSSAADAASMMANGVPGSDIDLRALPAEDP